MSSQELQLIASSPRGLADLLARELATFGASDIRERSTGVAFRGSLEVAYRTCLWSRIANRVFLELGQFQCASTEEFYTGARAIAWSAHIGTGATIACDFSGRHPSITHTHFGALKLKDAIVDALRADAGLRPDVALERPSVRLHAHANGPQVSVSLDLSGESLHRRSYRGAAGEAPLKENVAAGLLVRSGWPELAAEGGEFLDPMCGSGTLVIEAALIAADMAPGAGRDYFGFLGWRGHDAQLWERLREEAQARNHVRDVSIVLRGQDRDIDAVRAARGNAQRAGVQRIVQFDPKPLAEAAPRNAEGTGLVAVNPPYGVRLEDREAARAAHRELGQVLRERFQGWHATVLTGAPELGLELGIRAHRTHTLWNGALECRLLRMKVEPESIRDLTPLPAGSVRVNANLRETKGAQMVANRLTKNLKRLKTWVSSSGVTCYRIYDADMPEYSFAIDHYRTVDDGGDEEWLYVQEYAAPSSVDEEGARRRRGEALSVLPDVTGVPVERIRMRTRRKQSGSNQYGKLNEQANFHRVQENGLTFRVNFDDYLDTGLFLDHRLTRARVRDAAQGKRFLNLFAYTGAATVYAAAGGASATTSVDLSNTYVDWTERNLSINGLMGARHTLVQADCREWLAEATQRRDVYDLIFLDPPTFSNSKRMEGVLDIRRDHPELIDACKRVLAPEGLLVFSTNSQKFKLDEGVGARYAVREISSETLPPDFERNPRIHRVYEIR